MTQRQPGSDSNDRLCVWLLTDGKTGHLNQCRGVARALQFHFDVDAHNLLIHLRFPAYRRLLSWFLNRSDQSLDVSQLKWFYRLPELPEAIPDLIVSSGGNTLYANVWLSRAFGCRNLFLGDIRRLEARHFSQVITFLKDKQGSPYFLWPITPVPVLPEETAQKGAEYRQSRNFGQERLWTVLIGGNGAGYRYQRRDWEVLVEFMKRASAEQGIRWLAVTSRRTGAAAERILERHFNSEFVAGSSLFTVDGGANYLSFVGAAEKVFCTEDSHMMITEAISSGKPVYSLIPRVAHTHWTNQQYLDLYVDSGYLRRLPIREQLERGVNVTPEPTPMNAPPLTRLGDHLADWWHRKAA